MPTPILATKLYITPPRSKIVLRPRLIERLDEGLAGGSKLTLISAAAGFGKTALVSEWCARQQSSGGAPIAWLSLDRADNNPTRFLMYLIAALQTIREDLGAGIPEALQSPQPPPVEAVLTNLLNQISTLPDHLILFLDDYHTMDAKPVDDAVTFVLEHLPPQLHLVIATRQDPALPLARLRARGQLTEVRAADLRFTPAEASEFLNRVMDLDLSAEEIAALETRTEGWIAGLQLAALAVRGQDTGQGHPDAHAFIQSFRGSHQFVLDYLIEEVLQQQSASVQAFLLRTSLLERMCGPLCDAVLESPEAGQATLEQLERANLFLVPLDGERHWYRYHHLFGDLLRQRLGQSLTPAEIAAYHIRASQWFEDNGLALEAFRHATAANDIERAERLMESENIGTHLRSVALTVLDWLDTLPATVLDAHPLLRVRTATLALMTGQSRVIEARLQAAEKALEAVAPDESSRDLHGQIACARATLALTRYDLETMTTQAQRARELLRPDNVRFRFTASWALVSACILRGDRIAAAGVSRECLALSQKSGHVFSIMLARNNQGQLEESDNQLYRAAETYRSILPLLGDHPMPLGGGVYLGLARICYQWNDLPAAEQHGQRSLQLMRQFDRVIDRYLVSQVFLARVKLAQGDVEGAAARLAEAEQQARRQNFVLRLPEIADAQVLVLLKQDRVTAAAQLVEQYDLPRSRARVLLARAEPAAALEVLETLHRQMQARGWHDETLSLMVLETVALAALGEKDKALELLDAALALGEPGGFIRLFCDEGAPMADLLGRVKVQGARMSEYVLRVQAALDTPNKANHPQNDSLSLGNDAAAPLLEPLSPREREVLQLLAQGLSNQEIGERLFLALDTVKGHNRRIFDKLQVQRRTEAIARARALGLL